MENDAEDRVPTSSMPDNNQRRFGQFDDIPVSFGIFGSIKPKSIELLEPNWDVTSNICFKLSDVHSANFALIVGDYVSYYEDKSVPNWPTAVNVRPTKLNRTDTKVFETYFEYLQGESNADLQLQKLELAISCVPIWQSLGNCAFLSFDAILMLNKFILCLNQCDFLSAKLADVLNALLSTPLFRDVRGPYMKYVEKITEEKRKDEIQEMYEVVMVIRRLVPHKLGTLVNLFKPIVSDAKHSLDNSFYRLLQQCTMYVAVKVDDTDSDETPLAPSVQELFKKYLTCGRMCFDKCCDSGNSNYSLVCRKAREEEANESRKLELSRRQVFLDSEISKIKENYLVIHRTYLSRNGDTRSEYLDIEDVVRRFVQPSRSWILKVTQIEKITNYKLMLGWLETFKTLHDPLNYQFKLCEMSKKSVKRIASTGFHVHDYSKMSMFGRGIYFFSGSLKRNNIRYTNGINMLLVCDILLGKALTADTEMRNMTGSELHRKGYDSLFSKRGTKSTGDHLNDTFVVYNPNQAIPRYIVYYRTFQSIDGTHEMELKDAAVSSKINFTVHRMVPREHRQLSDSHSFHFCFATSNFRSLMSKQNVRYVIKSVDYCINLFHLERFQSGMTAMKQKYAKRADATKREFKLKFCCPKFEEIEIIMSATNTDHVRLLQVEGPFGSAVYFSDYPKSIRGYCNESGQKKLILCKVLLGNIQICKADGEAHREGYDSICVNGDQPKRNEIAVFDTDCILPLYVINYE